MDNSFVQSKRERRLNMWDGIQLITRERFLKSEIDPTHLEIIPDSDFELRSLQVMRSNIRHLKHSPNKEALEWRWNQFIKE